MGVIQGAINQMIGQTSIVGGLAKNIQTGKEQTQEQKIQTELMKEKQADEYLDSSLKNEGEYLSNLSAIPGAEKEAKQAQVKLDRLDKKFQKNPDNEKALNDRTAAEFSLGIANQKVRDLKALVARSQMRKDVANKRYKELTGQDIETSLNNYMINRYGGEQ